MQITGAISSNRRYLELEFEDVSTSATFLLSPDEQRELLVAASASEILVPILGKIKDRLVSDSDAYADVDLLSQIYSALTGEEIDIEE